MSGKGSTPRPFGIPREEYAENHARIFGAPKVREKYIPPPLLDESKEAGDISGNSDISVRYLKRGEFAG